MEVTGRDRVRFFKRPVLPNVTPLPYIRYSKELTQSVDDIRKRDLLKAQTNRDVPIKSTVSFTQTDFRDSEVQTDPCTLDYVYDYKDVLPEVSALETLTYENHGLPVSDANDLAVVESLKLQKARHDRLPTVGDPMRSLAQRRLIESQNQVEVALRSKSSGRRRLARNQQMRDAVTEFAETSAMLLQERLDRLWRHKQQEKEVRMNRIRKIHEKEIKALERKCQIKNNRLRSDLFGGKFKMLEDARRLEGKKPPAMTRQSRSSRGRKLDDNFLEEYNNLRGMERETSKQMSSFLDKFDKTEERPKTTSSYVPRAEHYNHLLESAYDDIVKMKDRQPRPAVEERTPEVSDDDDEQAFMQRHAEEVLRATAEKRFNRSDDSSLSDLPDENVRRRSDENVRRRSDENVRRRSSVRYRSDEEVAAERDAQIEAFLDQIEGETLGNKTFFLQGLQSMKQFKRLLFR